MPALIKNFGHLWERKYLFRGRPGVSGHLKGRVSPRKKVVDFRYQIGVYVLYDKDLKAVYVGQAGYGETNRMLDRLKQHEGDHLWNRWIYFSWYGIRKAADTALHLGQTSNSAYSASGSTLIEQLEGVLISVLEPSLNRQGAIWKGVEEYFQLIDNEVRDLTLYELREQIASLEKRLPTEK